MNYFIKNKDRILNVLHISGLFLLVVLTIFGVYQIRGENFTEIKKLVLSRWGFFLIACPLRLLDWVLDYYLWRCVLRKYSSGIPFMKSVWIYLSQGAGVILPAQLGRALRSYVLTKTTDVSISKAIIIEIFYLLCVGVGAFLVIFTSLGFYAHSFVLPIILCLLMLLFFPYLLKVLKPLLSKWNIYLSDESLNPYFIILLCIGCSMGWAINGLIFYLLLGGKESGLYLSQVQMIILGNLFIATCSGIPGGMGLIETTIGVSLHWLHVQLPEIILVIALFRVITFWIWIPVGWFALIKLKLYKEINLIRKTDTYDKEIS